VQAAAYRAAASEAAFQVLLFIGAFLRHTCSRKGRRHPSRRTHAGESANLIEGEAEVVRAYRRRRHPRETAFHIATLTRFSTAYRRCAQSNNTATGFDSIVGFKLDQRLVIERSGSYLSFWVSSNPLISAARRYLRYAPPPIDGPLFLNGVLSSSLSRLARARNDAAHLEDPKEAEQATAFGLMVDNDGPGLFLRAVGVRSAW